MDLREKTLALVTEDRLQPGYPFRRLNGVGKLYLACARPEWFMKIYRDGMPKLEAL